ncbi:hypothetical protein [Actinokineospora sp. NBRC 105648]|uniref:hypothetical protein n=1 Tax=Actinokineospora sp. NBRC 105648 TaxID=3032206 RepID=UPI00255357F8|nr:hypothetical protein [Actinokineospora sp. NBRC 105648]
MFVEFPTARPFDAHVGRRSAHRARALPVLARVLHPRIAPPEGAAARPSDRHRRHAANQRVKISVEVTAPDAPTTCVVEWKMVDAAGRLLFPTSRPVYFLVHVQVP